MDKITSSYENQVNDSDKEDELKKRAVTSPTDSGVFEIDRHISPDWILKITNEPRKLVGKLPDVVLRNYGTNVIYIIETVLKKATPETGDEGYSSHLPPIKAWEDEDGALRFEMRSRDFKVGLIIEKEIENSQWYEILKESLGEISTFGSLSEDNLKERIEYLLQTAINNS